MILAAGPARQAGPTLGCNMTDKELIALVETRLPQELADEELELLRARLRESAPVREALAGQLQLDQYLSAIVGHVEISPDAVVAASQASQYRRGSLWSLLGWTVCLLLVGFVAVMLVWPWVAGPHGRNAVADAGKADDPSGAAKAQDGAKTPADPSTVPGSGVSKNPGDTGAQPGQHPGDPSAIPAEPGGLRIEIDATAPIRQKNVQIMRKALGGEDIVRSLGGEAMLEYVFDVPAEGIYRLESRYTAPPLRSTAAKLYLNGTLVGERALSDAGPRGVRPARGAQFQPSKDLTWHKEGDFHLAKGTNHLKLSTYSMLPSLNRLAFVKLSEQALAAAGISDKPWQAESQLGGPPRSLQQVVWEPFDRPGDAPAMLDLQQWFKPVGGHLDFRDWSGRRLPFFENPVQFNGPWAEDNLLRLSLIDCQGLAIHFWKGQTGLTLKLYNQKWALAAYATDRDGKAPTPHHYHLLATDDGRNWNTAPGNFPLRLDLRFHGGELTVSRGDLVLLRRPTTACRARRSSTATA